MAKPVKRQAVIQTIKLAFMAAESGHEVFIPPDDPDAKIWRYMDFTKYVSMISTSSLFFARADSFDDPYEGAKSHANPQLRSSVYGGKIPDKVFENFSKYSQWLRQWTFINCWHMNEFESAAMWKLYAKTDEAIAVQSTYKDLHSLLPSGVYVGTVNYIDYEKEWMPEGNTYWPFVHKRKSFEYEKELRAVLEDAPKQEKGFFNKVNTDSGRSIDINVEKLIHKVYISPDAPIWFSDLVEEVTAKYELDVDIKHSLLGKEPIY